MNESQETVPEIDTSSQVSKRSHARSKKHRVTLAPGAHLEEGSVADSTSIYDNHPVDRLWKFCESVESSVKLVLPDSLVTPYYLPKPKNSRDSSAIELEREQRRFDVLLKKNMEERERLRGNKAGVIPKTSALTIREEKIGRNILLEYKSDPDKLFRLLQKVEAKKKQSKAKYQESKLLKESAQSTLGDRQPTEHASSSPERNHDAVTAEDVDTHSEDDEDEVKDEQADTVGKLQSKFPTASTILSRMDRALCRRSTLLKEHEEEMKAMVEKWQERVDSVSQRRRSSVFQQDSSSFTISSAMLQRQSQWIVLATALKGLTVISEMVNEMREFKAANRRQWFALRILQKFVRKCRLARRRRELTEMGLDPNLAGTHLPPPSAISTLRRSMAGTDELGLYHRRVESATIITTFLQICSKQYKMMILRYVRKLVFVQRRVRLQLIANQSRLVLLNEYVDVLMPVFFAYLQVITAGKGNDLRNLTSMDQSRLRLLHRSVKHHSIVQSFDSASFHAFLRQHQRTLNHASRYLGATRNTTYCQMVNIDSIRRHVLLSLLFKKRYQFATRLESYKPVVIPSQKITRDDVLAFIKGERDPVVDYLEEVKRIEDEHREQYHRRRDASKSGKVYHQYSGHELCLCLLREISAEEFATAVLRITELAGQEFNRLTAGRTSRASASGDPEALSASSMDPNDMNPPNSSSKGRSRRPSYSGSSNNSSRSAFFDPDVREVQRRIEGQVSAVERRQSIMVGRRNSIMVPQQVKLPSPNSAATSTSLLGVKGGTGGAFGRKGSVMPFNMAAGFGLSSIGEGGTSHLQPRMPTERRRSSMARGVSPRAAGFTNIGP